MLESTMPLLLALLLLALPAGSAQAAPGDIAVVSSEAAGTLGNSASSCPVISSDGRYVAFRSRATNLVTPATSGLQVFRKDTETGEVRLVSANAAGEQGNGFSTTTAISADGRYVAFYSDSTNLVTPGTSEQQVFRKDMVTGEVRLVSANAAGTQGNHPSSLSSISADGRYVAFNSRATNLVTPATSGLQVFRKDTETGEVRLVSANAAGAQGNGVVHPFEPDISLDGRFVCFTSDSTDLVAPATSGREIFRKDMETGEVALVSANAAGAESNMSNGFPSCSGDGRFVSFTSNADNLIPGVPAGQVYRKDMVSGAIVLVSSDAVGNPADLGSQYSSISEDGRYVALQSNATNLVDGDANGKLDIFRKDLVTWKMELVSASAAGVQGDDHSEYPVISGDGRYVAFHSSATNLIPTPTTTEQVFRKELAAPYRFFFAEGYTGAGFQEYLCLGNPSNVPVDVRVTYLFGDGPPRTEIHNVPGRSRVTRDVNALAGADRAVSLVCEAEAPFIAERPMYFDYRGAWTGGHDAVGAEAPSTTWYFAEGYTGPGFEEWVCVMNPWESPAELTFRFQTQEEGEKVVGGLSVPAHGRSSILVNQLLGGGSYQTSLKLTSSLPVVAERPMYFNYQGTALWGWTGGHCVMGATSLRNGYFFAEGTTRRGFEEWLTLQNPGTADINVHATYMLGTGETVERDYPVPAGKRETVLVNDAVVGVGPEQDVSVRLSSGAPFLAERPMYFAYPGTAGWGWTGGTASSAPPTRRSTGSSPRAIPGTASRSGCASRTPGRRTRW
ncbi:MAG: PD40 domain-containing protein [Actinobacteria bacterium]|nr:PD40 domain-containing protein [Actinomycetota bacterium]